MKKYFILALVLMSSIGLTAQDFNKNRIQPYAENPQFWQYHGQPVLLVGGSSDDNLFQIENLKEELDLIKSVGGNYVRNTMSSRDAGNFVPFVKSGNKYNPDKFNKKYWDRLEQFLKLTSERGIFVQIEVWAFHDFNRFWPDNSWNPANNIILTESNTKLKNEVFENAENFKNNFFFSVPKLNNDKLLLSYQQEFVDKLLSVSLKYDHVLYCITNEIFSQYSPEWGWYWAGYMKEKAKESGKGIEVTEMYQTTDLKHEQHKASLDHPEVFTYVELSQNSANVNQNHWDLLHWAKEYIAENIRPVNHVKTYGGLSGLWTHGPNHGIERFWRNIIGGAASVRFHRPFSGLGISERAQRHIKSASMLANDYDFFTSVPDVNSSLLLEREADEAYIAKNSGDDIVVYFPDGGEVIIDLTKFSGTYTLKWLDIEACNWFRESQVKGGGILKLNVPFMGNWVALLTVKN